MSSAVFEQAQRDLMAAQAAQRLYAQAMIDFQAACIAGDWKRADQARVDATGHLEAFLDRTMDAHKRTKGV